MIRVMIDGSAGTTGLRLYDRLRNRTDIELITLPEEKRKDPAARKEELNRADVAFLCLPDEAAIEAVSLIENDHTIVLDTSTAHRTSPDWVYGFPELSDRHEAAVRSSRRIAVPGCHAGGFIALIYPLIEAGLLSPAEKLSCHSLTGYSGGGKKMIAAYEPESGEKDPLLFGPRQYGLTQNHKHLKEMKAITGLETPPIFCPIVDDFYSGMALTVPLFASQIIGTVEDIKTVYRNKYRGPIVSFSDGGSRDGFFETLTLSGKDTMQISVFGNEERILLTAVYDNLGKGASGAALECFNLITGKPKDFGLDK